MYNYLQSARFPSQWFLSALCAGRRDQIQSSEGTQRKARLNGTGDTHTRVRTAEANLPLGFALFSKTTTCSFSASKT